MAVDTAIGLSMSFGTSGWSPNVLSIAGLGQAVNEVDTTHLGTTTARTKVAGVLETSSDITMEVQHDPSDMPTIGGTAETVTITFADATTCSFSAFVKSHEIGNVNAEDTSLLTGTVVLAVSGDLTWA